MRVRYVAPRIVVAVLGSAQGCSQDINDISPILDTPAVVSYLPTVSSENWRYLVTGTQPMILGGPGGPEDLLYHGARMSDGTRSGGNQQAIIDRLAANGGDALYVQAVKSHGGDGIAANGTYPACPTNTSCYLKANPFPSWNPTYSADPHILDQWDTWLRKADAAGIVTQFFLYDDGACPWYGGATGGRIRDQAGCRAQTGLIPEENARLITPVVNRLKALKNIVWVVGEEYSEAISTSRARAIAAGFEPSTPITQSPHTSFPARGSIWPVTATSGSSTCSLAPRSTPLSSCTAMSSRRTIWPRDATPWCWPSLPGKRSW